MAALQARRNEALDYIQRIDSMLLALNMELDAAANDGYIIHVYLLPSHAEDQDNPIIGVRLGKPDQWVSEDVTWIGMPVPHAEEGC